MLHCIAAQLYAKGGEPHKAEQELQAIDAAGSGQSSYIMQNHASFKAARLRRSLGLIIADAYQHLSLPAGRRAELTVRISGPAEWDWALEGRDVDYSATFTPDKAAKPSRWPAVVITPETRHEAAAGPVEGRCALPDGCESGVLVLSWSNAHSYLRSKALTYRVQLANGAEAPKAVVV